MSLMSKYEDRFEYVCGTCSEGLGHIQLWTHLPWYMFNDEVSVMSTAFSADVKLTASVLRLLGPLLILRFLQNQNSVPAIAPPITVKEAITPTMTKTLSLEVLSFLAS